MTERAYTLWGGGNNWQPTRIDGEGTNPQRVSDWEAAQAIMVIPDQSLALVRSEVANFLGLETRFLRKVVVPRAYRAMSGNWYVIDNKAMNELFGHATFPRRSDWERVVALRQETAWTWFAEQGVPC